MNRILGFLFFALLVKPVVFVLLGLNRRGLNNLPRHGPAIIAANHNSHLDTMVLMSLYPLHNLHRVRPVAAADYFLRSRWLAWFSRSCIGIIPMERGGAAGKEALFADCHRALDNGDILILFPEGSRGRPEELGTIKRGLFHIVNDRDDTAVTPVMMHGLGRALPRNEALLVPFNCDVIIGARLPRAGTSKELVGQLTAAFEELRDYCITRHSG